MRWVNELYGTERTIRKFALLPINVRNEYRWLEMVTIRQSRIIGSWENLRFIDE